MTAAARKRVTAEDIVAAWRETTLYPHLVRWAMTPIVVVNEANAHENWRVRHRRSQIQRTATALVVRGLLVRCAELLAATRANGAAVLIVRECRRRFDSDGLAISAKSIRDGVADAFRVDDRSASFYSWAHDQVIGEPGTLIAIGVKAPNQPHLVVGVMR